MLSFPRKEKKASVDDEKEEQQQGQGVL